MARQSTDPESGPKAVMEIEENVKQELPPVTWSREEEKTAVRKLDWCLVSLLGLLYMVSYIDRGNLGNAYTAGMGSSWGITSAQYSWVVTIYYISYILFQWLILVWKLVPLRAWTAAMAMGWGIVSMAQAATTSYASLMALRFLIGIFEAGFVPAVALYMSFFYHRAEMGLRYGLFISFSPLANCFASSLAYGIVHAHTSIKNWQLLFVIEGIPTIFLAIIAYIYLPASPGECRFLDAQQNNIISTRALRGRGDDHVRNLKPRQIFAAMYDYKNYLQAIIIFCLNCAFGSLPAYLPTILTDMGYTSLNAQGLSACPQLAAFFACVGASFLSDRLRNRGLLIIVFSVIGAAGYMILATVSTIGVRYFATFLVCAGVFPAVAITFTWVTDNQGSSSKRGAGLAIFGMIGQCGPILGSHIFPKNEAPYYEKGMWICAGVLLFAAGTAAVLSLCLRWQNRRRDRMHGKSDLDHMPTDIADVGDAHPMYRYVL